MRLRILASFLALVACFATPAFGQAVLNAEIKAGKIVGERTLRVKQGEQVELSVRSDRSVTLHLHGYDIERTAEPDKPAVFSFTAKATGRFSIQSIEPAATGSKGHSHSAALLYLEVLPR
jgi:hypothetical protein